MSILPTLDKVFTILLPQQCLLCGAHSGDAPLCGACTAALPMRSTTRCPVCALPTPGGMVCGACLKSPPAFDASHAVWRYAFPVDKLVQALKFSQRLPLARSFAAVLHIPLDFDTCRRARETLPQSSLPWKERRRNIKNAFECRGDLSGKSVIVVDDVMTTGATLDEFARTLKRHGAVSVPDWVVARALKD